MSEKKFSLEVFEDEYGQPYINFPPEVINAKGWIEGDALKWTDNGDGSYTVSKVEPDVVDNDICPMCGHEYSSWPFPTAEPPLEDNPLEEESATELVMVECLLPYRIRYCVEVPKGKTDWALDTVVCEETVEFSQKALGEIIMSHRVIDKNEFLRMCDEDNDYLRSWSDEMKIKNFLTPWKED